MQGVDICCARLADKKVSVRVNNKEVHILPTRKDCTLDDIEEAIAKAVESLPDADEDW